jgi:hypothetical protein
MRKTLVATQLKWANPISVFDFLRVFFIVTFFDFSFIEVWILWQCDNQFLVDEILSQFVNLESLLKRISPGADAINISGLLV